MKKVQPKILPKITPFKPIWKASITFKNVENIAAMSEKMT